MPEYEVKKSLNRVDEVATDVSLVLCLWLGSLDGLVIVSGPGQQSNITTWSQTRDSGLLMALIQTVNIHLSSFSDSHLALAPCHEQNPPKHFNLET